MLLPAAADSHNADRRTALQLLLAGRFGMRSWLLYRCANGLLADRAVWSPNWDLHLG